MKTIHIEIDTATMKFMLWLVTAIATIFMGYSWMKNLDWVSALGVVVIIITIAINSELDARP